MAGVLLSSDAAKVLKGNLAIAIGFCILYAFVESTLIYGRSDLTAFLWVTAHWIVLPLVAIGVAACIGSRSARVKNRKEFGYCFAPVLLPLAAIGAAWTDAGIYASVLLIKALDG